MLNKAGEFYQSIWKAIIRPPRDNYNLSELGPKLFTYNGKTFRRRDFELVNKRNLRLQCSHFEPVDSKTYDYLETSYPCVIYLHGNCSSRIEALNCGCLRTLLPQGISVLCFDFAGSGHSDGEHVSLGMYERDDLEAVVAHLRELSRISTIGLWGRSMGAVTACMYADEDPSIAGMVIDSPFSSLKRLAEELVDDVVKWKVPKILVNFGLSMVRNTILARAKFDIDELRPIDHCKRCYIPALFIAASNDTFIRPEHCKEMHESYKGDKNFIIVAGTHNSHRPFFLLDSIGIFFQFALRHSTTNGISNLWENVAMSLATNEQNRREKLLADKNEKTKVACAKLKKVTHEKLPNKKDSADQFDCSTESSQECSTSCETQSDTTRTSTRNSLRRLHTPSDDDDDSNLVSSVAQMMILESIQSIPMFECPVNSPRAMSPLSEDITQPLETTNPFASTNPLVNMPVAPHRVKDPLASPSEMVCTNATS